MAGLVGLLMSGCSSGNNSGDLFPIEPAFVQPPDPCRILPLASVSAVLGVAVTAPGGSPLATHGDRNCAWVHGAQHVAHMAI